MWSMITLARFTFAKLHYFGRLSDRSSLEGPRRNMSERCCRCCRRFQGGVNDDSVLHLDLNKRQPQLLSTRYKHFTYFASKYIL